VGHVEVTFDGLGSIGFRRDDGNGAAVVQFGAQPIHIEGFVGEQSLKVDALDRRRDTDTDTVVTLAWHQDEARKIAQRIDRRSDWSRANSRRGGTRRSDLIKILWHDGVDMSLYAKRLDHGKSSGPRQPMGAELLALWISGLYLWQRLNGQSLVFRSGICAYDHGIEREWNTMGLVWGIFWEG